jgi:hypothetical protein
MRLSIDFTGKNSPLSKLRIDGLRNAMKGSGCLDQEVFQSLEGDSEVLSKMLNGLIKSLASKL